MENCYITSFIHGKENLDKLAGKLDSMGFDTEFKGSYKGFSASIPDLICKPYQESGFPKDVVSFLETNSISEMYVYEITGGINVEKVAMAQRNAMKFDTKLSRVQVTKSQLENTLVQMAELFGAQELATYITQKFSIEDFM